MQTPGRSSQWVGTFTGAGLLLASLLLGGAAGTATAQMQRPANPLRTSPTPVSGSPAAEPRPFNAESASKSLPAGGYGRSAAPRSVGFTPRHEKRQPRGYRPIRALTAQDEQPRGEPVPAEPLPAEPLPAQPLPAQPQLSMPIPADEMVELAPGERLVEGPFWEDNIVGGAGSGVFADADPGMPIAGLPPHEPGLPPHGPGVPWHGPGLPLHGGGGACCDGGTCGDCCHFCPLFSWRNLELSAGVQGFTGAVNRGETGSFGFHYGLNWGTPLPIGALGGQVGVEVVQSNFSGAEFTSDERNQVFLTAGLFRRVDWGWQGGVVVDYMRDDWYLELDLLQLRGELSWRFPNCHELGFWFTTSTREQTVQAVVFEGIDNRMVLQEDYETNDLFAFFYRRHFSELGGEGRVFAGFSGASDGLLGADLRLPISPRLTVRGEFTYLIPEERSDSLDHRDESWNVGLSLVWRLGPSPGCGHDYYRPLFNVANNGNFLIRRQ